MLRTSFIYNLFLPLLTLTYSAEEEGDYEEELPVEEE